MSILKLRKILGSIVDIALAANAKVVEIGRDEITGTDLMEIRRTRRQSRLHVFEDVAENEGFALLRDLMPG